MKFKHSFILVLIAAFILTACAGTLPAGAGVDDRSSGTSAPQVEDAGAGSADDADSVTASETPDLADGSETPEIELTVTEDGSDDQTPAPGLTGVAQGEHEFIGTVDSINGAEWTIGGQTFTVTNATEFKNLLKVGDLAKVHVVVNADGTITITEIGFAEANATPGWDDNGQDPANHDSNDDNGQDSPDDSDDNGGSGGGHGGDDDNDGNDDNSGSGGGGGGDDDGSHGGGSDD